VVGGLALLAAIRDRRRTVALALTLLLSVAGVEGVAHALLHLGHRPHADTLTVGAAALPPAAAEPEPGSLGVAPLPLLGSASERYDAPATLLAVESAQGRSPPTPSSS